MESRKMVPWTYSQSRTNLFLYTTTILQFVSQHGQYSCQTGSSLQCSAFISLSSILWKSMWNRYKKCEEPSLTTIKMCCICRLLQISTHFSPILFFLDTFKRKSQTSYYYHHSQQRLQCESENKQTLFYFIMLRWRAHLTK